LEQSGSVISGQRFREKKKYSSTVAMERPDNPGK
jgi:hypothetical protein